MLFEGIIGILHYSITKRKTGIQNVIPFILGIMNILEKNIYDLLLGVAKELNLLIANVSVIKTKEHNIVQIYLEKTDSSITLDECSIFSRKASIILDVYDVIKNKYTLEVSSLGINRPLFNLQDYKKFIGQKIQIRTRIPVTLNDTEQVINRKNFKGTLSAVEDEQVIVEIENNLIIKLDYHNIEKGNLDILEPLNTKRKKHAIR